jgi:non-lysosomal glucosylceramidase
MKRAHTGAAPLVAGLAGAAALFSLGCDGGGGGAVVHVPQGPVEGSPAPYPPVDAGVGPDGEGAPRPLDTPVTIPALAWSHPVAQDVYVDGAPIGGLGAGSVTWRFDGAFYQDRVTIGANAMEPDPNCGFAIYEKAGAGAAKAMRLDSTALRPADATYHALFPRAFVDYHPPGLACPVRVEQWSPLIPGDYRRASYPVGVYRWEITNPTAEPCDVAIMLTWHNPLGGQRAEPIAGGGPIAGLTLRRAGDARASEERQAEFTIATRAPQPGDGVTVSYQSGFDRATLEAALAGDGVLANSAGAHAVGAVAVKVTVAPGARAVLPIVLAWDAPITQVGTVRGFYREYTHYFGRSGLASAAIAAEAIADYPRWQTALEDWQDGVLGDPRYPDWLKTMLFNELYYYLVAGTTWEAGVAWGAPDSDAEDMFSSLESFAYPFYGTSDVRFYGSWALAQLWPELDKQEVRQFCDSVVNSRADRPPAIGTCAHDLGGDRTAFSQWNAYDYRDSREWKDLNSKLVLMVYRDWMLQGKSDGAFLSYCWPAVTQAMDRVHGQDSDGDGLPNSAGVDQTYDDMEMTGNTAYCGGLFLAAAEAAAELADAMGEPDRAAIYRGWRQTAGASFDDKLWTGSYYAIDTGSPEPTRIMSDQLAGQWYAGALGLPPIVDPARAQAALTTIHDNNFKRFAGGTRGVVNVMTAAGGVDATSVQTREAWIGTSWGVVAALIQAGLTAQAEEIGASLYDTIWNTDQLWFRTPEAWDANGVIRAPYYMRATTLWAVKRAYDLTTAR